MATDPENEAELRQVLRRLKTVVERENELGAEKIDLYRRARALGATWEAIGASIGISDVAVMRAVRRADEASGAGPAEAVVGVP